jgi:hypothetical protein
LLTPEHRRKLTTFLEFLQRLVDSHHLELDSRQSNRHVVLDVFSRFILSGEKHVDVHDEHLIRNLVDFMLDNCPRIFQIPQSIADNMETKIIHRQKKKVPEKLCYPVANVKQRDQDHHDSVGTDPVCFCEQVTHEQYEQQKRDIAQDALLQLLDNIVDDVTMTPTTKQRLLQQFQLSYPALYSMRCFPVPQCDSASIISESRRRSLFRSSKSPGHELMKRSLTRLRSLRL